MAFTFDPESIQIEDIEEETPALPFDLEQIQIEDVPEETIEPEIKPEPIPVQPVIGDRELSAAMSLHSILMSLPRQLGRALLNVLQRVKLLARPSNKSEYINYALNFEESVSNAEQVLYSTQLDSTTYALVMENLVVLRDIASRAKQDVFARYPVETAQEAKKQKINVEPEKTQWQEQRRQEATLTLSDEDKSFLSSLLLRKIKDFQSNDERKKWMGLYSNLYNYQEQDKYLLLLVDRYYGTQSVKRSDPTIRPLTGQYWTKEQRADRLDEIRAKESGVSIDDIRNVREQERRELNKHKQLRMGNPLGEYGAITTQQDYNTLPEEDFEASESNFTSTNYLPENIPESIKQLYNQMIEFYKLTQTYLIEQGGFDEVAAAREATSRIMEMIIPIVESIKKYDPEFVEDIFADDMNLLLFRVMESLPAGEEVVKTESSQLPTPEYKDTSTAAKQADIDYFRNYARERAQGIVTVFEPDQLNPKKITRKKVRVPILGEIHKQKAAQKAKKMFDEIMSNPESAENFRNARRLITAKQFQEVYGPEREAELTRKKPEQVHGLPTKQYKIKETEEEKLQSLLSDIDNRNDLSELEKDLEKKRIEARFYRDRLMRDLSRGQPLDPIALSRAKELVDLRKGFSLSPEEKEKVSEHKTFAKILGRAKTREYSNQHRFANKLQNIYTIPSGSRLELAKDIITQSNNITEKSIERDSEKAIELGYDPNKVIEIIRNEQKNYLLRHTIPTLSKIFPTVFSNKFTSSLNELNAKDIVMKIIYRISAAIQLRDEGKLSTARNRILQRKNDLNWLNMFLTVES